MKSSCAIVHKVSKVDAHARAFMFAASSSSRGGSGLYVRGSGLYVRGSGLYVLGSGLYVLGSGLYMRGSGPYMLLS
jgi:hypothetical protein